MLLRFSPVWMRCGTSCSPSLREKGCGAGAATAGEEAVGTVGRLLGLPATGAAAGVELPPLRLEDVSG